MSQTDSQVRVMDFIPKELHPQLKVEVLKEIEEDKKKSEETSKGKVSKEFAEALALIKQDRQKGMK